MVAQASRNNGKIAPGSNVMARFGSKRSQIMLTGKKYSGWIKRIWVKFRPIYEKNK